MATTKDVKRKPLLPNDLLLDTARYTAGPPGMSEGMKSVIGDVRTRLKELETRPIEVTVKNVLPFQGIGLEATLFFASGFLFGIATAHWLVRVL